MKAPEPLIQRGSPGVMRLCLDATRPPLAGVNRQHICLTVSLKVR